MSRRKPLQHPAVSSSSLPVFVYQGSTVTAGQCVRVVGQLAKLSTALLDQCCSVTTPLLIMLYMCFYFQLDCLVFCDVLNVIAANNSDINLSG